MHALTLQSPIIPAAQYGPSVPLCLAEGWVAAVTDETHNELTNEVRLKTLKCQHSGQIIGVF